MSCQVEFVRDNFGGEAIVLVIHRDGEKPLSNKSFGESCTPREDLYSKRMTDMTAKYAVGEIDWVKRRA